MRSAATSGAHIMNVGMSNSPLTEQPEMYQKILLRIAIIAMLGLTVAVGFTRVLGPSAAASPAAQAIPTSSASIFYKFDVIAKTNEPTLKLKTIGTGVSINDHGKIAFVGETSAGEGVYVGDGRVAPKHMNPNFTARTRRYN